MTRRQRVIARALHHHGDWMTAAEIQRLARRRRWQMYGMGQGGIITAARAIARRGVVDVDEEHDTPDGVRLAFRWASKHGPTAPQVEHLFDTRARTAA